MEFNLLLKIHFRDLHKNSLSDQLLRSFLMLNISGKSCLITICVLLHDRRNWRSIQRKKKSSQLTL